MNTIHKGKISIATPNDLEDIIQIRETSRLHTYPLIEPVLEVADLVMSQKEKYSKKLRLAKLMEDENKQWIVYWLGEQPVGYIYIRKSKNLGEIVHLFVLPEHSGKGIGTRLMKAGLKKLQSSKRVELTVLKNNISAISFYTKFKFRKSTIQIPDVVIGTKQVPLVKMVRTNSPSYSS